MACKEVSREINGKQMFCRQWSATRAMEMKAKLLQIGGEDVIAFVEGEPSLLALVRLEKSAKPAELVSIIKEFVCAVRVEGEEITPSSFDHKYAGELWEVIQVFAFACEVNFKDFFEQGLASQKDPQPQ